jgi:hypothetical protein
MKLQEVTLFENKTHRILNEGYVYLNEEQKAHVDRYEKELWPLIEELQKLYEQTLSSQQIMQIFRSAEEVAMDSGANRTGLGKAGDAAAKGVDALKKTPEVYRKIQAKLKELQDAVKDSGPVKNMDATFNNLKKKISDANPDNEIVKGVQAVSDWAKANPGKATIAVGILTAVASFISGPVGGAAAGFILRNTKDLLQGKDLSTALGNSIKTAAFGLMAGWLFDWLGNWVEGLRAEAIPFEKEKLIQVKFDVPKIEWSGTNVMGLPASGSYGGNGSIWLSTNMNGKEAIIDYVNDLAAKATQGSPQAFSELVQIDRLFTFADARTLAAEGSKLAKQVAQDNDLALKLIKNASDAITALAQGSIAAGDEGIKPEDVKGAKARPEDKKESLEAEYERYIAEGPFGNIASKAAGLMKKGGDAAVKGAAAAIGGARAAGGAIKKGAEKAADVAGDAADYAMDKTAPMRKELGNKITQAKLQQAWKDLGEPKDVASIYDILNKAGMDPDLIQAVGVKSDVKLTKTNAGDKAASVDLKKLAAEIKKAGAAEIVKKQLASVSKSTPKVAGASQADKAAFQQRADRARSMKARPAR